MFVFAVKYEDNIKCRYISDAGAKYSFYIYVIHIMIRNFFNNIDGIIPFAGKILDATKIIYPVIVFVAALVVSIIYVGIKNKFKNKCEVKK